MNKRSLLFAVILTVLIIFTAGCLGSQKQTGLQTVTATRGNIALKINGNGNLSIASEARLGFNGSGKINRINADKGDHVTKGMLLAAMDTSALNLSLTQAETSVIQYRYNLTKLQKTTRAEDITAAESAITAAQAYLDYSKDNQKALQDALKVAQSNYDMAKQFNQKLTVEQAQYQLSQAQAAVSAGLADLAKAEANIDSAQAQLARLQEPPDQDAINAAQAQIDSAEKSVTDIKRQITESVIIATMNGVVAEDVTFEEGDTVPAGQPIFHIIDPSNLELIVDVDEIDIPNLVLGQKAAVTFDALTAINLEGTVSFISPLPTSAGGVILYKATISLVVPQDVTLKAGMSAGAEIIVEQHNDVVILPNRAFTLDEQQNSYVTIKTESGTVKRQVVTGITDGFDSEIVSGLDAGETVIIPETESTSSGSLFGG
jgi:HlyD family secretion protein